MSSRWIAFVALAIAACKRPPAPGSQEEAASTFARNCAPCHGAQGRGDGPSAMGLKPKPRDFRDPEWQRMTEDQAIEAIIGKGGAAVGKSVAMPPNPELAGDAAQLAAMRKYVRTLGSLGSAAR